MRGDMADHKFTAFYLAGGRVVAANGVNSPRDVRFARMFIEQKTHPDSDALGDPETALKSLLAG